MIISISLMRKVGSETFAQSPQGMARMVPGLMAFICLFPGPPISLSSRILVSSNKWGAALVRIFLPPLAGSAVEERAEEEQAVNTSIPGKAPCVPSV